MIITEKTGVRLLVPEERQIDIMNSDRFGAGLAEAVQGPEAGVIILDLHNVLFLDSSALGKIVQAARSVHDSNRKMAICGMTEPVALLFKMVRIDQIIPLYPDAVAAAAALAGSSGADGTAR